MNRDARVAAPGRPYAVSEFGRGRSQGILARVLPARSPWDDYSRRVHPAVLSRAIVRFYSVVESGDEVCGHSLVVARYARLLAEAMGVQNKEFLRSLELGALLHDIGKIGLPPGILMKKSPLSSYELEIVREHPVLGYEMISGFEVLRGASEVVLYHHERYDGRGYPCGLSGKDIPLPARIFSVADTLDALTSDRPYRKGRSFPEAEREIILCRGTQFDPEVSEAFLRIPYWSWASLRGSEVRFSDLCLVH